MASYAHAFPRISDIDAPGWRPSPSAAAAPAVRPCDFVEAEEEAPITVRSVGVPHCETIRPGLFQAPDESGLISVDVELPEPAGAAREEDEPRTLRSDEMEIRASSPRVLARSYDPASQVFDAEVPGRDPRSLPPRRPLESGIVPASMIDAIESDEAAPAAAAPLGTRLRGLVSRVGAAAARFVA